MTLEEIAEHVRERAAATVDTTGVPGYLAGVYRGGEQVVVAYGVANAGTGAPMTEDTGFLLGSITKVLTATLVLRYVERGRIDLDERVIAYVPQFRLPGGADIRGRHLLTHTDGIDADLFFPMARGRDALAVYVDELSRRCGTLFEPGRYVSYSNGAFLVAGRVLEAVTGECYHDLLEREIYGTVGMASSSTSAEQAILRRTAVGHFFDGATGKARRTGMFMLPETWSAAGGTPIVTIGDLLAFARSHLDGGRTPAGGRLLSEELVERMRAPMGKQSGGGQRFGLGWALPEFGDATVLWHGGGSPGGSANLVVVPEHDLAFATFGNDPRAGALHEELAMWLLRDVLGLPAPGPVTRSAERADLGAYEGTFRSNQLRIDITAVDGQLEQNVTFEPFDAANERILRLFAGGMWPLPPQRFVPVGEGLFAPAGVPLEALSGIRGRHTLLSFHGNGEYRGGNGRLARRAR